MKAAEKEVKDLSEEKAVHQVRTRTPKKPPSQEKKAEQSGCHRCGGSHDPVKCRFKHVECHYCHKKGHIAAVCRQKAKRQPQSSNRSRGSSRTSSTRPTNTIAEESDESSDETLEYPMHCLRTITDRKPWSVELEIEGTSVRMEIDTGATLSIMSQATYDALWMTRDDSAPKIKPTDAKLRTYSGEKLDVVGAIDVDVKYQSTSVKLNLVIVKGDGPTLMGRDWLQHIRLDWAQLNNLDAEHSQLKEMLAKHSNLFQPGLGKISGTTAKLYLRQGAKPKFCRARTVPIALREKIEQEIARQVEEGILESVNFSEWATPIVPVIKKDGSVRLCGDYKVTVNQASEIDDILASLAGGTLFSKLDLAHAYQQIVLDDESKKL